MGFVIGFVIGSLTGVVFTALCQAASHNWDDTNYIEEENE